MNYRGIYSLYYFELKRFFRTIIQSILSPILTTSLGAIFGGFTGPGINPQRTTEEWTGPTSTTVTFTTS